MRADGRRPLTSPRGGRSSRTGAASCAGTPPDALLVDLVPLASQPLHGTKRGLAGHGTHPDRGPAPVVVKDHGRIDGAQGESMGPVFVERVVRKRNHPAAGVLIEVDDDDAHGRSQSSRSGLRAAADAVLTSEDRCGTITSETRRALSSSGVFSTRSAAAPLRAARRSHPDRRRKASHIVGR